MEILFWFAIATIAYVYAGYPLLLAAIARIRGDRVVSVGSSTPTVTMIISAFNEADVIEGKLRNTLSLDYPDRSLEIIVVSDASTDGTDAIVERFTSGRLRLIRMPYRGGKTVGLNEAVAKATGQIIVFSDANAIYDTRALRMLVRNFHDPKVGAVVGESAYTEASADADKNESSYWRYEVAVKHLESRIGSVVGGDGAIYAIRRECYQPMAPDALSDFVNPLQIVRQGYRCIYEPGAISVEKGAGGFHKEFRRKVRIVNRAWRATMTLKALLNPFRYGLFSLQLVSHKLLRWLIPGFLIILLAANVAVMSAGSIYLITFTLQAGFYTLALVGLAFRNHFPLPVFLSIPLYFCLVNAASLKGIAEVYLGKSYTTWETARAD